MPRIVTSVWFDREAAEAAAFYVSIFPNSSISGSLSLNEVAPGGPELADGR